MALRTIRIVGDPILHKQSKFVTKFSDREKELVYDMLDTMYEAEGVGLAAVQVGVLKRIVVIDVSEEANSPIILINPEIIETRGEQEDNEGCLSLPKKCGRVKRPSYVKVKAQDLNGLWREVEGEELLARALCHEIDHLNGILYSEHVIGGLQDVKENDEA